MATKLTANQHSTWNQGNSFLLQWDVTGIITTNAGERKSRIRGEAVLFVRGDHEKSRGVYLERFGLAATGVEARKTYTGVITVRGYSSTGAISFGRRDDQLRIEAACDINYESLDRAHGVEVDKGCYYIPATEPASTTIEGRIINERGRIYLDAARLHVSCMAGEFEEVIAIDVFFKRIRLIPLPELNIHYHFDKNGEWMPSQDSNIDSNVCISSIRRRISIQPVGFRDSATDASPSGNTSAAQLATAQTVWGKACIDLVILPTVLITNATLKTSSNLADIRNAYTDSDPNVIEVFFVANSLAGNGGGNAGGIGAASCKPVIAEPNGGNPVLVAHELGHVLNLLHPGTGSNSDPGTVMAPTGSAMAPGTQLVTHIMCTSIANPVLQTTTTMCCLTHDIPNHYLRDFPTDAGNEPSEPIGAGMNRYAMSNVWNRLTNTPGTPSTTTGPEHQHPVRFNTDMTPRTNFLFARVEQLVNLPVRNAVVKFFLKNPGSGGGAANLQLLGQVNVPAGLGIGSPQNVSIAWTIPTGTPNHSCIFAVVRSDAEPEGDQSSLDWWQFETLSYNDNDWAQRNLDIENVSSSNAGDSNVFEGGPYFIYLPPARQRPSQVLTLEIDATKAKELVSLRLEIIKGKTHTLTPGKKQSVRIDIRNIRELLTVVIHGEVPGGLKQGTDLIVGVNPFIGKRGLIGWACVFRVAPQREVVAQAIDDALAAFGDIIQLADVPSLHTLFCKIGRKFCERPYSFKDVINHLLSVRDSIEQTASELNRLGAGRTTEANLAAKRLLKLLEGVTNKEVSHDTVVSAYRTLSKRTMMTAALLAGEKV